MSSYIKEKTQGDTSWYSDARFGMFIHWGIYALPARHEWVKTNEKMSEEDYDVYFNRFDPDLYDPREWARNAKAAGMKYVVFTTKHHDGFCMWDSAFTDYKCTNTPANRDLLRELVDAFREEGLHIGLYYSLLDWHHPHFTIDAKHPRCNDVNAKELNKTRDMRIYAKYMRDQITELLTNYGKIEILWLDFFYPDEPDNLEWPKGKGAEDFESDELLKTIRQLQPDIIINNRSGIRQDLSCPEQYEPTEWLKNPETGELVTWENGHTFSGSWGYYRDEQTWKTPETLIRLLINAVSLGGNMIMNVGPTARGYFDYRAVEALGVYEKWMKYNSRSIYNCTMAEPDILKALPTGCLFTQSKDGKRLYLHLISYPFLQVKLPGLAGRIKYAQFLHDGSEIKRMTNRIIAIGEQPPIADEDQLCTLLVPAVKPDVVVPVIEIFLD